MEDEVEDDNQVKKTYVSDDDLYRRSTQYRLWSFLADDLREKQVKANEYGQTYATTKFNQAYQSIKQENPEVFEQYSQELQPSNLLNLITVDEEIKFIQYYSNMIIKLSSIFQMPTQVKATAISLFKKFYLHNSVMEYHPKNILYTCLFLAAKSENFFISIESFIKPLKKTIASDILDLEFIVLQSLKFTLMVHHPFRPLYGFFLDFQAVLLFPSLLYDVNIDTIGQLYDKAKTWLNDYALLSNVSFLFTPPQIALAALYDCDKRITDKYLKAKFIQDKDNRDNYELLVKTIRKCVTIAKESHLSTKDESTEIDRKCYFCLHPKKLIEKKVNKLKGLQNNDSNVNNANNV